MKNLDDLLSEVDDSDYKALSDLADEYIQNSVDSSGEEEKTYSEPDTETDEKILHEEESFKEETEDITEEISLDDGQEEFSEKESSPPAAHPVSGQVIGTHTFSARGTQPWNTREPYVLDISLEQLEQDMGKISGSFYFIQDSGGESGHDNELRDAMISYLKKKYSIADEYSDFIDRLMINEISGIADFFQIGEHTNLFLYHCGPHTVFKILLERLKENKTGYCYHYLHNRRAQKFFPQEYLKQKAVNWYESNINTLSLDFNSITMFKAIKQIVQNRYLDQKKKFNQALALVNERAGNDRHISAGELLARKGSIWFPSVHKCVYKRFLGNLSIDLQ